MACGAHSCCACSIDRDELRDMLRELHGRAISTAEVERMMALLDTNGCVGLCAWACVRA